MINKLGPDTNNPVFAWANRKVYGPSGSAARIADSFKTAFGSLSLLDLPDAAVSQEEKASIREQYFAATDQIRRAFEDNDSDFFRTIATGLDELKARKIEDDCNPASALYYVYITCYRVARTKGELVTLAKRAMALYRVCGDWVPPFIVLDPECEARVEEQIKRLPVIKWNRYLKPMGLNLPASKPVRGH